MIAAVYLKVISKITVYVIKSSPWSILCTKAIVTVTMCVRQDILMDPFLFFKTGYELRVIL